MSATANESQAGGAASAPAVVSSTGPDPKRGTEARTEMAAVKAALKAGTLTPRELLLDPPACAQTKPLGEVLMWIPGVKDGSLDRLQRELDHAVYSAAFKAGREHRTAQLRRLWFVRENGLGESDSNLNVEPPVFEGSPIRLTAPVAAHSEEHRKKVLRQLGRYGSFTRNTGVRPRVSCEIDTHLQPLETDQ